MNREKAAAKPRTLEVEFSTKEMGSDGNAKFVRKAHEERTMKTAPSENRVYLERLARGERKRSA